MKALILAGGFGTRLRPVVTDRPKPMALINSRPFLEYVLDTLKANGINQITIAVSYLASLIQDYFGYNYHGVIIDYSVSHHPLGTAGTVKQAQPYFNQTFLVCNGDTYLKTDFKKAINFHKLHHALATIILANRPTAVNQGSVILDSTGKITSFLEKLKDNKPGLVNAGYYIFEPEIFKYIPSQKILSLEKDIFPKLIKVNRLYGFVTDEDFIDIGTPMTFHQAQLVLPKKDRPVIVSQVPVRISFCGGGTDIPAYFQKNGGQVITTTINKYIQILVVPNKTKVIKVSLVDYQQEATCPIGKTLSCDNSIFDLFKAVVNYFKLTSGVDIIVKGNFPAGSGLGSSSATTVALIAAVLKLQNKPISKKAIAKLAVKIERDELAIPGGWQDQYACCFGGFNQINFTQNGQVVVKPPKIKPVVLANLENHLLLFYLPSRRSEKAMQQHLVDNLDKKPVINRSLNTLKLLTDKLINCLIAGNLQGFAKLLDRSWQLKKKINPWVSNKLIDKYYQLARTNGALGGKLLGAGGGGCLLLYVPQANKKQVIDAMIDNDAQHIPFRFEKEGLQVKNKIIQ